jgi:hypothetical protein
VFQHAYFYFGIGKVQTAAGITLALLEQLCTASGYSPPLLNSKVLKKQETAASHFPNVHRDVRDEEDSRSTTRRSKSRTSKQWSFLRDRSVGSSKSPVPAALFLPSSQTSLDEAWSKQDASVKQVSEVMVRVSESAVERQLRVEPTQPSGKEDGQRHPPEEGTEREELPNPLKTIMEEDAWKLPDLETLITALQDTRRQCDSRLFIVLDGWDEENMIEPEEFRILLDALRQVECNIFLTSRSHLDLPDETVLLRMSSRRGREIAPQQVDIVPFIERLLRENPRSEELAIEYENMPRQLAELSNGV